MLKHSADALTEPGTLTEEAVKRLLLAARRRSPFLSVAAIKKAPAKHSSMQLIEIEACVRPDAVETNPVDGIVDLLAAPLASKLLALIEGSAGYGSAHLEIWGRVTLTVYKENEDLHVKMVMFAGVRGEGEGQ